jgi:hypothetical protein
MKNKLFKFKNQLGNTVNKLLLIPLFVLSLQVFSQSYIPGNTYYDSTGYVEFIAGNLPFIISVPHGGYLKPSNIPDRNCSGCSYIRDSYTQELGREIQAAFIQKTGCYPNMVINLLHRIKFDANRDIGDAADGNATVEQAWYAYHSFIDSSKSQIIHNYGNGVFFDLHGHGHTIQRIELGYLLNRYVLQSSDSNLNTNTIIGSSSIKSLTSNNLNSYTHAELIRGSSSFGTILVNRGFDAIPSTTIPNPIGSDPYFSGGYNTRRHSSVNGGVIDGIQMECNHDIRFDSILRKKFADSLVLAIIDYYNIHYNNQFIGNYCGLLSSSPIIERTNLNIFPNPASDQLFIESNIKELNIDIYNSLGQKVLDLIWQGEKVDISNLKKGVYYLQFSKNEKIIHCKTLIKM